MATAARTVRKPAGSGESVFTWEGKDKNGRVVRGETRAGSASIVQANLRRQGISNAKVKKRSFSKGGKVTDKDIALFTRQLATMLRSGVPLLQTFDIAIKGASNPALARLLNEIRSDIESGAGLANAFRKHPVYFDSLYANLVAAGEQSGALDALLDRLATYKEKILAIKSKIKGALFYPISVVAVAFGVVAVMMLFVIPQFKSVFTSFGAELPAPTLLVMSMSDFFIAYWYLVFGGIFGAIAGLTFAYKRSPQMQFTMDRLILQFPVIGAIIRKATVARWTRTLATMFAAGVPLVEALDSVGGAAGNRVYELATKQIQNEVSTGTSLTISMQNSNVFPTMVVQMVSIGEESGQLDSMLGKVSDFFEREVDDAVDALSQLLEPLIIVFLGTVVGGLVVAMYLPIFKLGQVV
ncbi:type II secretion system F family protein [Niveibacterium umoris]|uniref:Type IV pilus assembly protein PilC n=1 Tax=Niveibacterium umoris TaxID=1193620 RepID=A0A840BH53_9RHOO|nr:type II secretion system F family protein [Niveibacterium umoris]MBB4012300.1 type IV pilus assembly protein PilC [Niveibacterium umoris]